MLLPKGESNKQHRLLVLLQGWSKDRSKDRSVAEDETTPPPEEDQDMRSSLRPGTEKEEEGSSN